MGTARGLVRDFLYRYVARYRRMALLSLALMLVVAVSRMAPAYILKVAIDRFISRGDFYGLSLAALLYLFFICLEYGAHLPSGICNPALRPEHHTGHEARDLHPSLAACPSPISTGRPMERTFNM